MKAHGSRSIFYTIDKFPIKYIIICVPDMSMSMKPTVEEIASVSIAIASYFIRAMSLENPKLTRLALEGRPIFKMLRTVSILVVQVMCTRATSRMVRSTAAARSFTETVQLLRANGVTVRERLGQGLLRSRPATFSLASSTPMASTMVRSAF